MNKEQCIGGKEREEIGMEYVKRIYNIIYNKEGITRNNAITRKYRYISAWYNVCSKDTSIMYYH